MKNGLKISLVVILALSLTTSTYAQNEDFKSNIYLGAGFSVVGGLVDAFGQTLGVTELVETKSLPAIQVNYDYGVTKWLSVGAGVSYQSFSIDVSGYEFFNDSLIVTEDFSVDANRLVAGARIMFHYANDDKLDLYSGIRLNYKTMSISTTSSDPFLDLTDFDVILPFGVQIVPFAARYYVTDNIGISIETAIGAPHFFSVGANYRM
jgi:hypothetical protein